MFTITNIHAREILDSRGEPTIEAEVFLHNGAKGSASVPKGASRGIHEAKELRDGGKRYEGKGVRQAVENINNTIRNACMGKSFDQKSLDETLIVLDGTLHKEKLGANAILAVSLAFAHAIAIAQKVPLYESFRYGMKHVYTYTLPVPLMNVLNGGAHALDTIDIQEIMLVPAGAPSFSEALRCGSEIFHMLHTILREKGYTTGVGDEGGFAIPFASNEEALYMLARAVERAHYRLGNDVFFALDVAASELYKNGAYVFKKDNKEYDVEKLIEWYGSLITKYPIISIEDGCAEDDWEGWQKLTEKLGSKIQLVGDDLFVTNKKRLQEGIDKRAANAILIKPNQIGTVSETQETILLAHTNGYGLIMSHRSGETEDTTIADMAVGWGIQQIKAGAPNRGERVAKYNQLIRIEENMHHNGVYAGKNAFPRIS